ncbi:MAG: wax ester/triacylglycerol synthase family O-acyltransferase [Actinomycetia bacterium]|nr:wax ester/triacylglycerol synthase family O-acyltransferase [Actinomycetes bacterium]
MRQLTATDAAFLNLECHRTPMHLTSLLIFDQSETPGGFVSFEQILQTVNERASLLPTYRERLLKVPLDLGYPWWYDDGEFDAEFHVRQLALPKPGDWHQLCIQTARLASRPLDLTRPLWEMTVIEGLDHVEGIPAGSLAMVLKTHHSAIDGASGMQLLATLLDSEPQPDPIEPGAVIRDSRPSPGRLVQMALASTIRQPARLAKTVATGLPGVGNLVKRVGETGFDPSGLGQAPSTRFGAKVTPHRVFEGTTIELDDLRPVKGLVDGATVNDVILSIVGGTVRRYLDVHGELPDKSLITAVPISVRSEGDTTPGNQLSAMVMPLHTDIADPIERLAAVRQSAVESKLMSEAVNATHLLDAASQVPAGLATLGMRLVTQLGLSQQGRRVFNTTVTNVPGSAKPSYMGGARLVGHFGMGPIQDGAGLFHAVMGVERRLFLSVTACRETLPDPAFYRQCMDDSVAELAAPTG